MSNLKFSMRGKGQSIFEMVGTSVHRSSRSLINYPFPSISKQVFCFLKLTIKYVMLPGCY